MAAGPRVKFTQTFTYRDGALRPDPGRPAERPDHGRQFRLRPGTSVKADRQCRPNGGLATGPANVRRVRQALRVQDV